MPYVGNTNQQLSYAEVEKLVMQAIPYSAAKNLSQPAQVALAQALAGIAMAESSGNTADLNDDSTTGDYSVGLFQVNYFDKLREGRTQAYGSPEQLAQDPLQQAAAAIAIFTDQGFGAWQGDSYVKGLGGPQQAMSALERSAGTSDIQQTMQSTPAPPVTTLTGQYQAPANGSSASDAATPPTASPADNLVGQAAPGGTQATAADRGSVSTSTGAATGDLTGNPNTVPSPPGMNDMPQLLSYIQANYPSYAWLLDMTTPTGKEVAQVLEQAVANGWDSARIQAAVAQTSWWRSTSDALKNWEQNKATNPGDLDFNTAGSSAQQMLSQVRAAAQAAGLQLSPQILKDLATEALMYGWNSQQITQNIGAVAKSGQGQVYSPGYLQGMATNSKQYEFTPGGKTQADQMLVQVQAAASQAGLKLSQPELQTIATRALQFGWSSQQITAYIGQIGGAGQGTVYAPSYLQGRVANPREYEFTAGGKTQADQMLVQVKAAASQAGLRLSEAQLQTLATRALQYGWSDQQLTAYIGQMAGAGQGQTYAPSYLQGATQNPQEYQFTQSGNTTADQMLAQVRLAASQAGLRLSEQQLQTLATRALQYGWTPQQVTQYIGQVAGQGQGTLYSPTYLQGITSNPREYDFTSSGTTTADQALASVRAVAATAGVQLTSAQEQQLAMESLRYGWSSQQIQQQIGQLVTYGPGQAAQPRQTGVRISGDQYVGARTGQPFEPPGGNATGVVQQLSAAAAQQYIQPSPQVLQSWAQGIAGGTKTMAEFNAYLQTQAELTWQSVAPLLKQGYSMEQITDNLRNLTSSTLEIDPSQVNFTSNPQFSKMLDGGEDGSMMTYSQAGDYLRRLPQYATTTGARGQAADVETAILQAFGRVG
jgi:hypothetical protein